jgi:LuxR family maltose regulon positive regulatory protein
LPIPCLLASLSAWVQPAALVLNDIHRIVDKGALDIVSVLLDRLPNGFRVALAGRSSPDLPFARLRAQRRLQEIGTTQLALDADEAAELVRLAGADLSRDVVSELTARTEGWAAGIYLAALGRTRLGEPITIEGASGADRYVADYLRAEVGRALAPDDLLFLMQTAALETIAPGPALAVTGLCEPGDRLERLAAANLLITRVARSQATYRYHDVLREFLQDELERRSPGGSAAIHAEAAAYYAANGMPVAAVEHALASRDLDTAARHMTNALLPVYQGGHATLVIRWLDRFSVEDLERYPMLAALGAWPYLLEGATERADLLGDITERTDTASLGGDADAFRTLQGILRVTLCRHGFADFMGSATSVYADRKAARMWRAVAAMQLGIGHLHAPVPDLVTADALLEEACALAPRLAAGVRMTAAARRAAIRQRQGDVTAAVRFVADAHAALDSGSAAPTVASLIVHAVDARVRGTLGDIAGAREALVRAQLVRPLATYVAPWQAVPALLYIARAYLIVSDPAGAQTAMRHAENIVRRRPGWAASSTSSWSCASACSMRATCSSGPRR